MSPVELKDRNHFPDSYFYIYLDLDRLLTEEI